MKANWLRVFLLIVTTSLIMAACGCAPSAIFKPTLISTSVPRSTIKPTGTEVIGTPLQETAIITVDTDLPAVVPTRPPAVQSFPDAESFEWQLFAEGFNLPVDLVDPADGSGQLWVVEQGGLIRVFQEGAISEQVFLDISDRVKTEGSEQGLLGMALDPGFLENKVFYLNYTDVRGDSVIARYQMQTEGFIADANSEQILLQVSQPYSNHNGGGLAFGPDGYLYIGLGDGGSAGDPKGRAQNPDTLLGKMLRIDVSGLDGYTIPADNPFALGGGKQEIWALGLRNPWRYSFDRISGDLYIADVGQNKFEEINYLPADSLPGCNFGWDYFEGFQPYEREPEGIMFVEPAAVYDHNQGCSVTGGFVYRGTDLPEFEGIYLFGDYCNGSIWGMSYRNSEWVVQRLFQINANISAFGQDNRGEIYLLDHRTGSIFILVRK